MKKKVLGILMLFSLTSSLSIGEVLAGCPAGQKNLHIETGGGFSITVKFGGSDPFTQNLLSSRDYCVNPGDQLQISEWRSSTRFLAVPTKIPADRDLNIACTGTVLGNADCREIR